MILNIHFITLNNLIYLKNDNIKINILIYIYKKELVTLFYINHEHVKSDWIMLMNKYN